MKSGNAMNLMRFFNICTIVASALALFAIGCAHQGTVASSPSAPQSATATDVVILPAAKMPVDYRIGPGDILEISVWKNEDLSRIVVVLPDGTISFPLVGRFVAGGKTVEQLKNEMEKRLSRYVPEPEMTIIIQQVNSMVVYVIGKVNRPGHFPLNRNIDVLQALSMAGGLNIFANPKDIRIFRKTPDNTMVISFNYDSVTEDNYLEGNVLLQAGDVIVVK
jgi:polysaccharide export outer membrane protein